MARSWTERLEQIDRRWVFLLIGLAIIFPLFFPLGLTQGDTPKPVQDFYDAIEKVPAGATVLVADDWDPSGLAELRPATIAVQEHLFQRGIKSVHVTLWEGGPGVVARTLAAVAASEHKTYGVDYAFLGFKSGREQVMVPIAENIRGVFPSDYRGTPVDQLPVLNGVHRLQDFALLISVSAGYPGTKEWVQQVASRFPVPMLCATGAVSAPEYYAYYESKQLAGMVAGLPAIAEYERMIGRPAFATKGMDAQSMGNYMLVVLIVIGNALYLANRRKGV